MRKIVNNFHNCHLTKPHAIITEMASNSNWKLYDKLNEGKQILTTVDQEITQHST